MDFPDFNHPIHSESIEAAEKSCRQRMGLAAGKQLFFLPFRTAHKHSIRAFPSQYHKGIDRSMNGI